MNLPLSNRLLACCGFVRHNDRVADVGCDHGYLGIYLLKNGIAKSVIASDVNENPLLSAKINAVKYGVKNKITFYLSDGLRNVPHDFDCMVCAGMGADTMISILEAAPWLKSSQYRLILQCQSKRPELRRYLHQQGYRITRETLAQDGKFIYPVMEVVYAPGGECEEWEYYFSPALLRSGSPLLPAFCARVTGALEETVKGLTVSGDKGNQLPYYTALLEALHEHGQ